MRVREDQYGDRSAWWSVRPRDAREGADRPAVEQVAHQVTDICTAIAKGFESVPAQDQMKLDYEQLMQRPGEALERVARFIGAEVADEIGLGALSLRPRNHKTVDDETWAQIQVALAP